MVVESLAPLFVVSMDLLYHVFIFSAIFSHKVSELNSKTLMNGVILEQTTQTYNLKYNRSYIMCYTGVGMGNITENTLNFAIISTGENSSKISTINWITSTEDKYMVKCTISGLALTVTVPSGRWINFCLFEL